MGHWVVSAAHSAHPEAGGFHLCILGLLENGSFEDSVPYRRANALSPISLLSFQLIPTEGTER